MSDTPRRGPVLIEQDAPDPEPRPGPAQQARDEAGVVALCSRRPHAPATIRTCTLR